MSGDEVFVLLASLILGPIGWAIWFVRLARVQQFGHPHVGLKALSAVVLGCALFIGAVLRAAAAPDVRGAPGYLLLYFVLGLAWLRTAEALFVYAGVSVRDDVIERRNTAAVPAVAGALIGVTCCYGGANVGAGPGWWVVVFSAALATAVLAGIWLAADQLAGVNDIVTIDRDPAAGVRLGGLLAATGLILGRAVAGDWHSVSATVADLGRVGWPVVPLTVAALAIERALKPTAERPRAPLVMAGVMPAVLYLVCAAVCLIVLGWPA
jgi:hypothetical protein